MQDTTVTIQANVEQELQILVDRHYEYSRLIEDIVEEVQALSSLRQFYTEDAGYQLALRVDTDLMNCATGWGDNEGNRTFDPTEDDWVHSAWQFNATSIELMQTLLLQAPSTTKVSARPSRSWMTTTYRWTIAFS